MVRNNELSLAQELVGYAHALAQQAAGVFAEIENQTFEISHFVERVLYLGFSGLVEPADMHVADARLNQEMQIDAVVGNLVAHDWEFQRLIRALAQDRNVYGRALGAQI